MDSLSQRQVFAGMALVAHGVEAPQLKTKTGLCLTGGADSRPPFSLVQTKKSRHRPGDAGCDGGWCTKDS